MKLINEIKIKVGIPQTVTVYDEPELKPLIMDAIEDMRSGGVPDWMLPENADAEIVNPLVATAIGWYVSAHHGTDRGDTETYERLYHARVLKLSFFGEKP